MAMPSPAKRQTPMSAHSPGPLTEDELKIAGGLLGRAVKHGQSKMLAHSIMRFVGMKSLAVASECFLESVQNGEYGSMSDGSKRLRDDESEWGLLTEEDSPTTAYYANTANPAPPMPSSQSTGMPNLNDDMTIILRGGEDLNVPLPHDVPSIEEWSRTVIKLPKLAKYNFTYAEFIVKAEEDAELSQYGGFLMANFGPYAKTQKAKNRTQGVDLAHFLARVKFDGSGMTQGTFRRVLRD